MTTSLEQRVPAPVPQAVPRHAPPRRRVLTLAVVAACAALAVLVGLDGTPIWRIARVLLVIAGGSAALWSLRTGPRRRATAALLIGVPAFVAGAGIGVPHAAAGGTLVAVAGLVCLVSGVVLLVGAAGGFWGATRGWGRAGVTVVAFVVAQWLLFPLTTAVFATNRAPTPLPAITPADVGLEYRDVTLATGDGLTLSGWYVPSSNGAAVVALHGSGSTRSTVVRHAAVLSERGYGVLLFDARGHGGSGGHAMDFGWYGDADIAAAVAYLQRAPDVRGRIGAVGLSMGGEEAIGAAAVDHRIAAVVAEGATGRRGADWLALRPAGIGRWFSTVFYAVQDTSVGLLSGAQAPIELRTAVVEAARTPVLLIAAGQVPQEATAGRWLQQAAPDRVELWEVAGVGHTGALAADPEAWGSRVGEFLDRVLLD